MAALISAGLMMCRFKNGRLEFFLVHPGGPFFKNKDAGVWGIPKGLPEPGEDLLKTAIREFEEETGIAPAGPYAPLGAIKQKRGKIVHAWTFIGSWEPHNGIKSNTFSIEWPPHSGKFQVFPEQDKAAWMDLDHATSAIIPEQIPFLQACSDLYSGQTTGSKNKNPSA
jgi:predicted NUDIX family NTP pyrophosphohydrolase